MLCGPTAHPTCAAQEMVHHKLLEVPQGDQLRLINGDRHNVAAMVVGAGPSVVVMHPGSRIPLRARLPRRP